MTESHIKKETWFLGNRGPGYIRNVTELQPPKTKKAARVKIQKTDLTFIFSSRSRLFSTRWILTPNRKMIRTARENDSLFSTNFSIIAFEAHPFVFYLAEPALVQGNVIRNIGEKGVHIFNTPVDIPLYAFHLFLTH